MRKLNREDIAVRTEYIVDLIKASGAEGVDGKTIRTDCGLERNYGNAVIRQIMADNPQIVAVDNGNRTKRYVWREDPIPVNKKRYEGTNKNNEGYTDMTATMAINGLEPKKPEPKTNGVIPEAGQVWATREANGSDGYIYVLGFSDNIVSCIKLVDIKEYYSPDKVYRPLRVKLGAITLFGDISKICHKPRGYLIRRAKGTEDDVLMKVRKELGDILGIVAFKIEKVQVPVEVEKVVEKVVYKEPEAPEGCIRVTDAIIQDLQHQVEAWRSIAWGVIKRDKVGDLPQK